MALPTSRVFIPGFRLIADDAGSYVDDVANIRLGPEFVLTRNTADPSAAISVSAYIAAQLAALPMAVLKNEAFSAASITIPFTANAYKRISVSIDWSAGGIAGITLTGMSASTYNYSYNLVISGSGGDIVGGAQGASSWVPAITGSYGFAKLDFHLPPAPAIKAVAAQGQYQFSTNAVSNAGTGTCSDTTHDPTAIVITLDTTRVGYVYAIGHK